MYSQEIFPILIGSIYHISIENKYSDTIEHLSSLIGGVASEELLTALGGAQPQLGGGGQGHP